jgi:NADP-dependent 3-hydroxy acid dehydrogenase YdfG
MSEARKAIVTGAGSGVGRATAIKLARQGWLVAIVGRNASTLEETIQLAGPDGSRLTSYQCDVGKAGEVTRTVQTILKEWTFVDALVNSAGFNVPKRSFRELSHEDFDRVVSVNLNGTQYFVSEVLPVMRERGDGTIVNIVSDAGITAYPKSGPSYVASKFGQRGLTMAINAEERQNGIRACCVCPGDIATKFLDQRPEPPAEDARSRMLQPEDVADCAVFAINMPPNASIDEIVVRPSGKPVPQN